MSFVSSANTGAAKINPNQLYKARTSSYVMSALPVSFTVTARWLLLREIQVVFRYEKYAVLSVAMFLCACGFHSHTSNFIPFISCVQKRVAGHKIQACTLLVAGKKRHCSTGCVTAVTSYRYRSDTWLWRFPSDHTNVMFCYWQKRA